MKYPKPDNGKLAELSRPARGAWIEIMSSRRGTPRYRPSRPARGAWIEIFILWRCTSVTLVAPREGRVD